MVLPTLPEEILVKIAATVAKDRYWYLGPLIMAGKQGRDIVYLNKAVLEGACIYNLCVDGDDISIGGRYRTFFVRCLEMENPIAIYHEGVRIVAQEGELEKGLELLDKLVLKQGDAAMAAAIFAMCAGEREKAGQYLDILSETHRVDLKSEDVVEMGRELLIDIRAFNPVRRRRYINTIKFPICESYTVPHCFANTTHYFRSMHDINCTECYIWSLATKVSWTI